MKIRTKVAGVSFRTDAVLAARDYYIKTGDGSLKLIREPTNLHDPDAVMVVYPMTGKQLGYVGRHLSSRVADHLDVGGKYDARILQFTGGGPSRNVGVNVELHLRGAIRTAYAMVSGKCSICGKPIHVGDFIAKKEDSHWWEHGECVGISSSGGQQEIRENQKSAGCASIVALVVVGVLVVLWCF